MPEHYVLGYGVSPHWEFSTISAWGNHGYGFVGLHMQDISMRGFNGLIQLPQQNRVLRLLLKSKALNSTPLTRSAYFSCAMSVTFCPACAKPFASSTTCFPNRLLRHPPWPYKYALLFSYNPRWPSFKRHFTANSESLPLILMRCNCIKSGCAISIPSLVVTALR